MVRPLLGVINRVSLLGESFDPARGNLVPTEPGSIIQNRISNTVPIHRDHTVNTNLLHGKKLILHTGHFL